MAAFATENPNRVWSRVRVALAGANEASKRQFDALKLYLATQGKNPQLQYVSFTDAGLTTAGGVLLGSGKPRVYGIYIKKGATATKSYAKVYDDATDDTTAANERIALPLLAASEEVCYVSPTAVAFASGVVIGADTTIAGTTDSTAGDAGAGFILVG